MSPRSGGMSNRRFTLGKMPNGKPLSVNFKGDHLTIDPDQIKKNERRSDRLGYNNFFYTKEYNIFNGKDKKIDELHIEHNDQSHNITKTQPRGYRNIQFRSYSKRPSIVTKKQNIHEKRFDTIDLEPPISTKSTKAIGIQFDKQLGRIHKQIKVGPEYNNVDKQQNKLMNRLTVGSHRFRAQPQKDLG